MNYFNSSNELAETRYLYQLLRIRISTLATANGMTDEQYRDYLLLPHGFDGTVKPQDDTMDFLNNLA
jgi:hypothetical protein